MRTPNCEPGDHTWVYNIPSLGRYRLKAVDSTWDFTATPNTILLHLSDDVPVTAASVSMVNTTTGLSLPASAQTLTYNSADKLVTVTLDGATNDLGVAGIVPDGDSRLE